MNETETRQPGETANPNTEDRNHPAAVLRAALPSATEETTPTPVPPQPAQTGPRQSRFQAWRHGRAEKALRETPPQAVPKAPKTAPKQRPAGHTTETEADIAPVPQRLRWLGIWLDRTFGAVPLAAPLVVSGYYTVQVFTGEPINAPMAIALMATGALEGGLWKLSRLYEKTLVAGDSTIALRAGIGLYLAFISGLIYWHADHMAKLEGREDIGWDWIPAAGVAAMCALGVFIWSRTARWMRRRELHAAGRVDKQAPKFASLAWVLTPIETPKALRHAVKWRIDSPLDAVTDRRLYRAAGRPVLWEPLAWKPDDTTETETADKSAARESETRPVPAPTSRQETPQTGTEPHQPVRQTETRTRPSPGPARPTRSGLHVAGRPTDEEYVRMVRNRFRDWADPNRRRSDGKTYGPVSASEVMDATGLSGKRTALRIQAAVYASGPVETTGRGESDSDDSERASVEVSA